jgi:uncharacterized membrane-anchored protein
MTDNFKKLAPITAAFWVMKISATTLGETAGDLLSMTLNIGYATSSLLLIGFFFITLVCQLVAKKYHPFLFWMVILSTSTVGTTMSDYMDRTLGFGYTKGASILLFCLLTVLVIWRLTLGSLDISHIKTHKAEIFYWVAILFSNTLGTALGDFLADSSGLGFINSALLVASVLVLVLAANYYTHISKVALFWIAFVLTRPFGATMGDTLTKSHEKGGLDFGTIGSSAVLAVILGIFIIHATIRQHRQVAAV